MKSEVLLNWVDELAFETNVNGHKIILDAEDGVGGMDRGPRPKPLLLVSLGGCTAMDVISILKKMRVNVKKFNVRVDSEITEEHPKHYCKIHIIYEFWGKDLPMDKLEKAVNLSQDKYCGVSYSLKKALELTYEIKVFN
ncbi:MAG: OsmC family protein [Chlorobi bacterium]|nr:OsmC family protein [Chlorobiota bacterium]